MIFIVVLCDRAGHLVRRSYGETVELRIASSFEELAEKTAPMLHLNVLIAHFIRFEVHIPSTARRFQTLVTYVLLTDITHSQPSAVIYIS
jgi:hypothetical protein